MRDTTLGIKHVKASMKSSRAMCSINKTMTLWSFIARYLRDATSIVMFPMREGKRKTISHPAQIDRNSLVSSPNKVLFEKSGNGITDVVPCCDRDGCYYSLMTD